MKMIIGRMRLEEDMGSKAYHEVPEQYKKAARSAEELQEVKAHQGKGKQQDTSYDIVSLYGDTLSISEEAVNSGKGDKPGSADTKDGIVIRKEVVANEQNHDASVVNLSTYTESELKQMYLDGDITRAEYDEEISSRETQG